MVIWYIFSSFVMLCQEQSGNPAFQSAPTLMNLFLFQAKELTDIAAENASVHVVTLDVKNLEEFDAFAQKVPLLFFLHFFVAITFRNQSLLALSAWSSGIQGCQIFLDPNIPNWEKYTKPWWCRLRLPPRRREGREIESRQVIRW
jgi:hypothetical protein